MLKQLRQKEMCLITGGEEKDPVELSGGGNSQNVNLNVKVNIPVHEQVVVSPYVNTHNGQPTGGGAQLEFKFG